MTAVPKEQVFMDVTSDLVKFYTFISHAMRLMTETTASGQITIDQVLDQIRNLHAALVPRVGNNQVVMKKVDQDHQKALALIETFKKMGSQAPPADRERLSRDAAPFQVYAQEKSACLSDLVAIFRGL